MAREGSVKRLLMIIVGIIVVTCIILGIGCWCLTTVVMTRTNTLEREYIRANVCIDVDLPSLYCTAFRPSVKPFLTKCECEFGITLEDDMKGAVTLYYELEGFDQTNSSYASSKDDQQLLGSPGEKPAESCGNYTYNEGLPIFPCGEIADSIFNDRKNLTPESKARAINMRSEAFFIIARDTYTLMKGEDTIPVEYTGLLTGNKSNFHNPPPEVLKKFAPPINWGKLQNGERPWEADTELKGVENPAFIAWMDTNLKRKPVWRVQRKDEYIDGLPAGNYTFTIMMHYGVDRYDGPRKMILESVYTETLTRNVAGGIILVLLASVLFALGAGYVFTQWKRMSATEDVEAKPSNDGAERPLANRVYNRLRNLRAN